MRGRADADQDDREPRGYPAKRLCEQDDQRQEREDQHRLHPGRVRIERLSLLHRLIDEYGRKLSAVDRKHRYGIESEYQCHTHRVAGLDPEGDDEEGGYVTAIECQDEETLNAVKEEDAVKEAVGGMDGELNESLQYEPNTVGAVVKLLSKSDPRDFLFIRLAPNMKQCMIYDIDRKVMAEGQSTTYLEIATGNPNK